MSAPGKTHTVQLVKIQPNDWLTATSEPNLRPSLITGYRRGKGLAGEPLGHEHIFYTQGQVTDVNKTGLITCLEKGRHVLLKSRLRENLKSSSVRGLIVSSEQNNLKSRRL